MALIQITKEVKYLASLVIVVQLTIHLVPLHLPFLKGNEFRLPCNPEPLWVQCYLLEGMPLLRDFL